eukprot:1442668-Amphidinium_carterae.1
MRPEYCAAFSETQTAKTKDSFKLHANRYTMTPSSHKVHFSQRQRRPRYTRTLRLSLQVIQLTFSAASAFGAAVALAWDEMTEHSSFHNGALSAN